jgi:hypothetical protein
VIGRGADIKMDIDVDVELSCQFEDAVYLRRSICVVARCTADCVGAALEPFDQKLISSGMIGEALLRENANLDVERSGTQPHRIRAGR